MTVNSHYLPSFTFFDNIYMLCDVRSYIVQLYMSCHSQSSSNIAFFASKKACGTPFSLNAWILIIKNSLLTLPQCRPHLQANVRRGGKAGHVVFKISKERDGGGRSNASPITTTYISQLIRGNLIYRRPNCYSPPRCFLHGPRWKRGSCCGGVSSSIYMD